jgi:hypothetical protein
MFITSSEVMSRKFFKSNNEETCKICFVRSRLRFSQKPQYIYSTISSNKPNSKPVENSSVNFIVTMPFSSLKVKSSVVFLLVNAFSKYKLRQIKSCL